ncbi:MAG: amino acid ABC transporter permease [Acidimicrobiales bacterium]
MTTTTWAPPARGRARPSEWARENLLRTPADAVLTVVAGGVLLWLVAGAARWVLFQAEWEIVRRNLTLFVVGRFPRDQVWRPAVAMVVVGAMAGVGLGATAGGRGSALLARATLARAVRRAWPVLAMVAVLLALVETVTPLLVAATAVAVLAAGQAVGSRLPARPARWAARGALLAPVAAYLVIAGFGGVGWERWGGGLLNLALATGGIALSFPFGVLLALGRRSSLPALRWVCVGYIELIRGVPLIALLFMGSFMLGFFLPEGLRPTEVTRAMIAIVLFTAAYVAEIVRGGLQSVPRGQHEAATALGLSPLRVTALVVLPQALRNVIPATVGQFISLFKDTSLVFIIGLTDLLAVADLVRSQPDFLAQGLERETLGFAAFLFWVGAYTMSRESQLLERRLGVGQR